MSLSHLKVTTSVTSIETPETKAEKICAKWYDDARRITLEEHTWNFATKRDNLAQDTDNPPFGYIAQSDSLPSDFIRMVSLGADEDDQDYEIEGNQILTNSDGPYKLRYIYNITDVTKFSPLFIQALSYKLAELMSFEFDGRNTTKNTMKELFEDSIKSAKEVDGQQNPPKRIEKSAWRTARRNRQIG